MQFHGFSYAWTESTKFLSAFLGAEKKVKAAFDFLIWIFISTHRLKIFMKRSFLIDANTGIKFSHCMARKQWKTSLFLVNKVEFFFIISISFLIKVFGAKKLSVHDKAIFGIINQGWEEAGSWRFGKLKTEAEWLLASNWLLPFSIFNVFSFVIFAEKPEARSRKFCYFRSKNGKLKVGGRLWHGSCKLKANEKVWARSWKWELLLQPCNKLPTPQKALALKSGNCLSRWTYIWSWKLENIFSALHQIVLLSDYISSTVPRPFVEAVL